MKLIMENWKRYLSEQAIPSSLKTRPINLKDKINFLVSSYARNPAIRRAQDSIKKSDLQKIDRAVKTLKNISKEKDKTKVSWNFQAACKKGMFGGTKCTLGEVMWKYSFLDNTSKVLQFNMHSQPIVIIEKVVTQAMSKLSKFVKDPKKFNEFIEILLATLYSSTYVHELYHYFEFSAEHKHETEEYRMMKMDSATLHEKAELRAIQVEEGFFNRLESSLPVHIKKTKNFPGYIGSWAKTEQSTMPALLSGLDAVFKTIFKLTRDQIKQYREHQNNQLFAMANKMWGYKDLKHDEPQSGPYARKNQRNPHIRAGRNKRPNFTSTGHLEGPRGKALTGPSKPLPRIKRRGDPRSD